MFPEDNITGNTSMMRDKIRTPIHVLSFSIAKETAKFRPRLKFFMLIRLKKNETSRTEGVKVMIVRR